jgi:hypothetical protein
MIISHSHKLIFLKARKVAGTSFEIALSKYLSAEDVITPIRQRDEEIRLKNGFRSRQHYRKPLAQILADKKKSDLRLLLRLRRPNLFYNHMSAEEVRDLVDARTWDSYLKVAIVRNPWDYVVSQYFYRTKSHRRPKSPQEWCLANKHVLGLNNLQYMIDGKVVVDHFIRYENFQEDIEALEALRPALQGLYQTFASISAKGSSRPKEGASVQEMFEGAETIDAAIRVFSAFEIDRFGYTK